jgi:hypothetical protein
MNEDLKQERIKERKKIRRQTDTTTDKYQTQTDTYRHLLSETEARRPGHLCQIPDAGGQCAIGLCFSQGKNFGGFYAQRHWLREHRRDPVRPNRSVVAAFDDLLAECSHDGIAACDSSMFSSIERAHHPNNKFQNHSIASACHLPRWLWPRETETRQRDMGRLEDSHDTTLSPEAERALGLLRRVAV